MSIKQQSIFGDWITLQANKRIEQIRITVAKVAHVGAGVQSSQICEMVVEGEYPTFDFGVFADTGDEPEYVYGQVEYLRGRLASVGIPLITVKAKGAGLFQQARWGVGRFVSLPLYTKNPDGSVSIVRRQCTREFKIEPSDNYILNWLIEAGHAKYSKGKVPRRIVDRKVLVENIYGISIEELYRAGKRGPTWQKAIYPLIDKRMTRAAAVKWLEDHNLPVPKKSSCKKCPFHEDEYWLDQEQNYPIDFEESCEFDDFLRSPEGRSRFHVTMKADVYIHRSCQPLRAINFAERIAAKNSNPLQELMCGDHCRT